jgi:hypothetical protein
MIQPNQLHWYVLGDDGVPELYLDNHMMQTFRACEQRFVHEFIEGYNGKGRFWFLDFGSTVHKCIEIYYLYRKHPNFNVQDWAINTSLDVWNQYDMNFWITHPDCEKLGGYLGLVSLLIGYAQQYNIENERFRVIGTELYFGKKREVPLGDFTHKNGILYPHEVRVYLSGKIDLLVDDGRSIGPMDHKTSKNFMGKDPSMMYQVHEGMEGYVYAARSLLANLNKDSRRCNTMWMNFMQVTPTKNPAERYKRLPITYTDEMFEDYRKRMLRTASKIYQILKAPDSYASADRNTMMCTNYMHNICSFQPAHRMKDKASLYKILNNDFSKGEIWNPETRDDKVVLNDKKVGKIDVEI